MLGDWEGRLALLATRGGATGSQMGDWPPWATGAKMGDWGFKFGRLGLILGDWPPFWVTGPPNGATGTPHSPIRPATRVSWLIWSKTRDSYVRLMSYSPEIIYMMFTTSFNHQNIKSLQNFGYHFFKFSQEQKYELKHKFKLVLGITQFIKQ